MRVLIIGAPNTGKTTLATKIQLDWHEGPSIKMVRHTDDTMHLEWSAASEEVSKWLDEPYDIIEGVALPRALRKWRERNPNKPAPVDKVIYLTKIYGTNTKGQYAMGKGIKKVWGEIEDWILETAEVEYR